MEYAGLQYKYGRCQDENCPSCKRELAADPKATFKAVTKLKHFDLSGLQAVDILRPLREEGNDPSLDLVFGPGFRTVQSCKPLPNEGHGCKHCGMSDDRGDGYCSNNCEEGWSRRTSSPMLWRNYDLHSQTPQSSRKSISAAIAEKQEIVAEMPDHAKADSVSTNVFNTNKRTEIGVASQHDLAEKGINGQDSVVRVKGPGRPKKWASDAERKAASRGLQLPAAVIARARDIKPAPLPRKHAPSVNESEACVYCDRVFGTWILKTDSNTLEKLRAEREHFLPKRLVGDNGQTLQLACHICNRFKSDRVFTSIEECRDWLKETWLLNEYESKQVHRCNECDGIGVIPAAVQSVVQ